MRSSNPMFEFVDSLLLSDREHYFTNQEILERYQQKPLERNAVKFENVKNNKYWDSLETAYKKIKSILRNEHHTTFDFKNGRDASQGYRYPLFLDDPMRQHKTDHRQMRLKRLMKLLQQSEGLMPQSWLADIIQKMSKDNEGKIISFDRNMQVENLQWVPEIFNAIENKHVISFRYQPGYDEDREKDVVLHPYFLKEYNSSWFTFGLAIDKDGNASDINIALDRIKGEIIVDEDIEYICPKNTSYSTDFFKDIIGVTKYEKEVLTIKIETHDPYTHRRIKARPLHSSQEELRPFSNEKPGLFSIKVIHNNELDTLLLSYGSHIRIIEPNNYVDSFREMVRKLNDLYFPNEKSGEKEEGKSSKDSPTENSTKDVQE